MPYSGIDCIRESNNQVSGHFMSSRECNEKAIATHIEAAHSLLTAEAVLKQHKCIDDTRLEKIAEALEGISEMIRKAVKRRKTVSPWEAARITTWWESREQNRR